ncbi:MAG: CAAX prenyl protease-related protein [bacterium]
MNIEQHLPSLRHVAPFLVWVAVMCLPLPDPAIQYAIQTVATLAILLMARPWRYYPSLSVELLPVSILTGMVVFVLWVLPESDWMRKFPALFDLYARYGIRGVAPDGPSPYAPEQCGWALAVIRLAGSALVIAVAEEFFWRGFLMRWMKAQPFLGVSPRHIGWGFLLAGSCLFGLEHSRWLAGILAGLAYGLLYIRTGTLWTAIIAHIVTNYLLGLYVLATGAYQYW